SLFIETVLIYSQAASLFFESLFIANPVWNLMFTFFPLGSLGGNTTPHSKFLPIFSAISAASNNPNGYMAAFWETNIASIGILFEAEASGRASISIKCSISSNDLTVFGSSTVCLDQSSLYGPPP